MAPPFGLIPNVNRGYLPNYRQFATDSGTYPSATVYPRRNTILQPSAVSQVTLPSPVSPNPPTPYGSSNAYANTHTTGWGQSLVTSRDMARDSQQASQDTINAGGGFVDAARAAADARRAAGRAGDHPEGPTVLFPGGYRGGAAVLPANANVVAPYGGAAASAVPHPIRVSSEVQVPNKNYQHPATQPSDPQEYVTLRQQQVLDPATGQPVQPPSTQPSLLPTAPPFPNPQGYVPNGNAAYDDAHPGENRGQIQLTDQQAREMWRNAQRPGMSANDAADAFHALTQKYGHDGYAILNHWRQNGTLDQTQQTMLPTVTPVNVPLSMLGPETGRPGAMLQPSSVSSPSPGATSYGSYGMVNAAQRESVPGPSITGYNIAPGESRPFPGATPLPDYTRIGAGGQASLPSPANMPGATTATQAAMGAAVGGQTVTPTRQAVAGPNPRPAATASKATDSDYRPGSANPLPGESRTSFVQRVATHVSPSTGTYWKQVNGQWQQVR